MDSPALDFISTSSEEVLEVDLTETGLDDTINARLGLLFSAVLGGFFGAHSEEVGFEFSGDGNHGFTGVFVDPLLELDEVLVALTAVVIFGEVDEEDGGLGGEEVKSLEEFDFLTVPVTTADLLTSFEVSLEDVEHIEITLLGLVKTTLEDGFELINVTLDGLEILQDDFLEDDFQITSGVNITFDVGDVFRVEGTAHVEDTVDFGDVGQEGVTETFTVGGTTDETSDITDVDLSGDSGGGLVDLDKLVEAVIVDVDVSSVGFDGAEGTVFSGDTLLGKDVEEGTLTDVGETDDTHLQGSTRATEEDSFGGSGSGRRSGSLGLTNGFRHNNKC